jgi:hypothetical protein
MNAPSISTETAALRHWVFGSDNTGLYCSKTDSQLTPVKEGGTPVPTHTTGYMTTEGSKMEGYVSDVDETAEYTVIVVSNRINNTGQYYAYGCYDGTEAGAGGAGFTHFSTQMRILGNNFLSNFSDRPTVDWHFHSFTFNANEMRGSVGNGASLQTVTRANGAPHTIHATPKEIALGNAYFNSTTYTKSVRFAEFIILPKQTDVEILAIYNNSKTRLAARSVTLP